MVSAWPHFWLVTLASAVMGVVGDVLARGVAALTLGLIAPAERARRLARNSAFDRAGNVAIALVVGVVGFLVSQRAVFLLVPTLALSVFALAMPEIRPTEPPDPEPA